MNIAEGAVLRYSVFLTEYLASIGVIADENGLSGKILASGGGSSNALTLENATWEAPGTIGSTTPNSGAFTTLSATGGITGNLTGNVTGNATTATTATNANALESATWTAPGAIGTTTPNIGAFTALSATGGITGNLTGNVTGNAATATTATNANALESKTWDAPGAIGSTTPNSGAFTTLSATGGITGNVTGTASNASKLENATWEAPGAIGSTTANTGTFTTVTANGTATALAAILTNAGELVQIIAAAPAATQTIDIASGSVVYFTTNAANNWVLNAVLSGTGSLNAALAVGQAVSFAVLTTQGSTAYYPTSLEIDGVAATVNWEGGVAPSSGNASGIDSYLYTVIKTAATPAYTVLASQTKY